MKRVDFNEYADFLNKNPNLSKTEYFPDLQEDARINRAFQDTIKDKELKEQISTLSSRSASTYQKYGFDIGVEYVFQKFDITEIENTLSRIHSVVSTVVDALNCPIADKDAISVVASIARDYLFDLMVDIKMKKEALYPTTQEPMDKGQPTMSSIA